jgi:hypothetical protein
MNKIVISAADMGKRRHRNPMDTRNKTVTAKTMGQDPNKSILEKRE